MKAKLVFASLLFGSLLAHAQIGIGTVDPDASAILDVESTTQGMLTPRMSTAQRVAISEPANGLLVYDLDESAFYFFEENTDTWVKLNSSVEKRDNFVLVKELADFPDPVGGIITLASNTYYEINGLVNIGGNTINLNNAYLSGLDANDDILVKTGGALFSGSTGGSIRQLTLTGGGSGSAFNIAGATGQRLLLQSTIVANFSSVGTLSGLDLFFSNIVQYSGNTTGITYDNINTLLLSNQGWFEGNNGTYETFEGSFEKIQKVSGFSKVTAGATGLDVSSNPNVTIGILNGTVFSGSGTYINKYTSGSFTGFNFTNKWSVDCPGIPNESDDLATANIYFNSSDVTVISNATPIKLPLTTTAVRQFRTSARNSPNQHNSIVYSGDKPRVLNVFGSISFTAIAGMRFTFSIYKNGVQVPGTQVVYDITDTNARHGLSLVGTVQVNPNDYLEVYFERTIGSGSNQFLTTSYNLIVN